MGTTTGVQAADLLEKGLTGGATADYARSPTASSRRRSAGRSSTTSGWSPPRRRVSGRAHDGRPTTCTRWSTRTACRPPIRSTRRHRPGQGPALTASCAPRTAPRRRRDLRRLRGQHDPALLPAVRAGHRRRPATAAADGPDHRRPPERGGRRLGVVLGRLVERQRRRRRARAGRTAPATPALATDPETRRRRARTGRTARTSCSSTTISRSTTSRPSRPGTPARAAHLRDEAEFEAQAAASRQQCRLKPVSFIKPVGAENEHPGYASETRGTDHLVDLLSRSRTAAAPRTRWSSSPTTSSAASGTTSRRPARATTPGVHDNMGPSTRIPALVLAPGLRDDFVVDHVAARHDVDHGDDRARSACRR